ncbi:MAG: hypothetical protein Q8K92_26380, partial [Leadbetterella sp.]|nr:hypothetical protein [Leadbetterella sp.]
MSNKIYPLFSMTHIAYNRRFSEMNFLSQYANAGNSISNDFTTLKNQILSALSTPRTLKKQLCDLLPSFFELKIRIIDSSTNPQSGDSEALLNLNFDNEALSELADSLKFAIRTNRKVLAHLTKNQQPEVKHQRKTDFKPSYDAFMSICGIMPEGQAFFTFVNCSLISEMGGIAFFQVVQNRNNPVSSEALAVLSSIVASATQDFGAAAKELGFWKEKRARPDMKTAGSISDEELKAEKDM